MHIVGNKPLARYIIRKNYPTGSFGGCGAGGNTGGEVVLAKVYYTTTTFGPATAVAAASSPDSLWSLWTDCCCTAVPQEIVFRYHRIAVTRPSVKPIFIYCRSPTRAWYVRHRGLFFFTIIIIIIIIAAAPRSRSNFPNYLFLSDGAYIVPRRKIVCSFFRLFILYSWCRRARAPPQKRTATVVTRRRGGDARARKPAGGCLVFGSYYFIVIYYNCMHYNTAAVPMHTL